GHIAQVFVDRESSLFVIWGHNERKKFEGDKTALPWIVLYPALDSGIANIDYEMSEGYSDRGAVLTFFKRDAAGVLTGMRKWGYRKGSAVIEDLTFEDTQGFTSEQLAMLKMLADGPGFMRWYRRKALHQIIEESQWLIRRARQAVRIDKFVSACSLREAAERDLASSPAVRKADVTFEERIRQASVRPEVTAKSYRFIPSAAGVPSEAEGLESVSSSAGTHWARKKAEELLMQAFEELGISSEKLKNDPRYGRIYRAVVKYGHEWWGCKDWQGVTFEDGGIVHLVEPHQRAHLVVRMQEGFNPAAFNVRLGDRVFSLLHSSGAPILFPFANRLRVDRKGAARWRDSEGRLRTIPLLTPELLASGLVTKDSDAAVRHGLVRKHPFDIIACGSKDDVYLTGAFRTADYPLIPGLYQGLVLEVTYRLDDGRWTTRTYVRNESDHEIPIGFCQHYDLNVFGAYEKARLTFPGQKLWHARRRLPSGRLLDVKGAFDFRSGRRLGANPAYDHVFYAGEEAPYQAWIDHEEGVRTVVEADPVFKNMVIYTPGAKDFLAVEPQTSSTDALRMDLKAATEANLIVLAPGEERSWQTSVRLEEIEQISSPSGTRWVKEKAEGLLAEAFKELGPSSEKIQNDPRYGRVYRAVVKHRQEWWGCKDWQGVAEKFGYQAYQRSYDKTSFLSALARIMTDLRGHSSTVIEKKYSGLYSAFLKNKDAWGFEKWGDAVRAAYTRELFLRDIQEALTGAKRPSTRVLHKTNPWIYNLFLDEQKRTEMGFGEWNDVVEALGLAPIFKKKARPEFLAGLALEMKEKGTTDTTKLRHYTYFRRHKEELGFAAWPEVLEALRAEESPKRQARREFLEATKREIATGAWKKMEAASLEAYVKDIEAKARPMTQGVGLDEAFAVLKAHGVSGLSEAAASGKLADINGDFRLRGMDCELILRSEARVLYEGMPPFIHTYAELRMSIKELDEILAPLKDKLAQELDKVRKKGGYSNAFSGVSYARKGRGRKISSKPGVVDEDLEEEVLSSPAQESRDSLRGLVESLAQVRLNGKEDKRFEAANEIVRLKEAGEIDEHILERMDYRRHVSALV
ncbi:MAG: hypothetical protein PHH75_08350, partial [Candidatus Omnitrophica bacterium]|nr:hypothetical protein [Candidatus Omnitrophota bacterium]